MFIYIALFNQKGNAANHALLYCSKSLFEISCTGGCIRLQGEMWSLPQWVFSSCAGRAEHFLCKYRAFRTRTQSLAFKRVPLETVGDGGVGTLGPGGIIPAVRDR